MLILILIIIFIIIHIIILIIMLIRIFIMMLIIILIIVLILLLIIILIIIFIIILIIILIIIQVHVGPQRSAASRQSSDLVYETFQPSLMNAFSMLEPDAQKEFTQRLSQGLKQRYWEVVPEEEALKLRRPSSPGGTSGHYLPANFALKT